MSGRKISFSILVLVLIFLTGWASLFKSKKSKKSDAKIDAQNTPFYALSVNPTGELSSRVNHPSVQVVFSEPVVPLKKLGEPFSECEWVTIEPKLNGVFRWYGTATLSFDCSDALIPQKIYTVKINPKTVSINGNKFSGQSEFSFFTEELRLVNIVPGYSEQKEKKIYFNSNDIPAEYAKDIAIYFSNKVNAAVIANYIEICDKKNKYEFTADGLEEKGVLLKLKDTLPQNTEFAIKLKKGAEPDIGYRKTENEQSRNFHTLRPFEFLRADGSNDLRLVFNHQIKSGIEQKICDNISFDPKMDINISQIQIEGNVVAIKDLPVTFADTYKFAIKGNTICDCYNQIYEKDLSQKIKVPDADVFANVKVNGFAFLESGFAPKLAYESQNIGDFGSYYKITPIAGVTDSFALPSEKTFSVKTDSKDKNRRAIKTIDLRPFLEKTASGEYRGVIKFENSFFYDATSKKYNTPRVSYVQVTDLGITTRISPNKVIANVSSLKNATPISNVEVSLYQINQGGDYQENLIYCKGNKVATLKTDENGIAVFEGDFYNGRPYALLCKTADDRAVFEIDIGRTSERQVTQIFTQSDVFRPKDTVQIKVIDRNLKDGKYSTYTGGYTLRIVDKQYRWAKDKKVFAEFTGNVTDQGTASAKWTVPEDAVPGAYYVEYVRGNSTSANPNDNNPQYAQFSVQYFERLRFSASAKITPITYTRGDLVTASVDANYLGGGTLSGGTARAEWNRYETHFYGSGDYAEYTFGPGNFQTWKYYDEEADVEEGDDFFETEEANLSDDGNARFSVKTGTEKKDGAPYNYNLQALVTDSGNQMIAARDSVMVHPAAYYIGVKQSGKKAGEWRGFPKAGQPIQFDYITLTPDLQKVQNTLYAKENFSWKLEHKVWKNNFVVDEYGFQRSRWEEEVELQESGVCKNREGNLTLTPKEGGTYILTISGADSSGRKVITEYSFYVTSSEWNSIKDGGQKIELLADKEKYEVGDTANIVLNSTLPKGSYLVTICADGVFDYQILHLNENSSVIEIPIKENYLPRVGVRVSSYSGRIGEPVADFYTEDQNKPQNIVAELELDVSTKTKMFDVKITPSQKSYRPGNIVQLELEATKDGAAVEGAELALVVVDKGVLGLTNYKINSPQDFFYANRHFWRYASYRDNRTELLDPVAYGDYTLPALLREIAVYRNRLYKSMAMDDMAVMESVEEEAGVYYDMAPMASAKQTAAGAVKGEDNGTAVQIRKDFNMTAAFIPCLKTDKDGKVNAVFTLPDTLTEYDVTVIGVKDDNFAKANESLKVANPISARDVQTKILRLGDLGEAGVVITNIGDRDEKVQITFDVESGLSKTSYKREEGDLLRRDGKASVQGEQTKTVTVEAGKTKSVMFNLRAQDYGWVTLSFKVNCSEVNEIIYKPLEIQKPYVYETVTTLGVIADKKNSAFEKIEFPSLTEDGKGSLYLQIDSTRLGTLRSAVDYVFHYPYGCMEQRSSATLPLVAFGEYIDIFGLNSEVEKPASVVQKELAEWAKVQRVDGGFPYWKGDKESSFGVSLQIAEVIALAKEKGISVPPALDVDKLASYIKKEYAQYKKDGIGEYLQAYCLYVIARLKAGANVKDINSILQDKNASISAMAFAALAAEETGNKKLAQETVAKIKKMMSLTTRGVTFQNKDYGCYYFFGGKIEQYALCLQLFSKVDATDLYVGRLVYELLEFQKAYQGTWHTTAATTRALIAINTYIKAAGLERSDLSAQVLLGGKKVLEGSFKGVGAEPVDVTFDFASPEISSLKKDTEIPLEVKKSGTGALYYTASMQYALPAAEQVARDEGLCVYAEITDARTGEKVDPSNLKSGTIYRQKVFVTSTKDRTFVALRAAVPAGTEILNAAFVTTASVPNKNAEKQEPRGWGNWWQSRMSHQDIYDAEIRCFWNYLAAGTQSFEFLFRANRTGVYQTPAVLAECMYEPEIFGRSQGYEAKITN